MSVQVNMAEAKARLSELVSRAEAGETVIIARAGRPAAEIRVVRDDARRPIRPHRRIGALAHLRPVSDEFLDMFLGPDPAFDPDKKDLF